MWLWTLTLPVRRMTRRRRQLLPGQWKRRSTLDESRNGPLVELPQAHLGLWVTTCHRRREARFPIQGRARQDPAVKAHHIRCRSVVEATMCATRLVEHITRSRQSVTHAAARHDRRRAGPRIRKGMGVAIRRCSLSPSPSHMNAAASKTILDHSSNMAVQMGKSLDGTAPGLDGTTLPAGTLIT